MSTFWLYLTIGFEHIADLAAYDHILFLLALCANYKPQHWKHILWLVSAFTVGHSLTLILATLNIFIVSAELIEFLIPVTIFITCLYNVFSGDKAHLEKNHVRLNYSFALIFGLIHGMGFSNYLRQLLGSEASIVQPLLSFNIGIELGQILIVSIIFSILFAVQKMGRIKFNDWRLFISGAAAGVSVILMSETFYW